MPETPLQRHHRIEKHLGKDIADLVAKLQETGSPLGITYEGAPILTAIGRFAWLLSDLYLRAEIQTRKVVRLTWGLLGLTVALVGSRLDCLYSRNNSPPKKKSTQSSITSAKLKQNIGKRRNPTLQSLTNERGFKFGILFPPHIIGGHFDNAF
jgi:hypothetical protein